MNIWDLLIVTAATAGAFLSKPLVGLAFRSAAESSEVVLVSRGGRRMRVRRDELTREKIPGIVERLHAPTGEGPPRRGR